MYLARATDLYMLDNPGIDIYTDPIDRISSRNQISAFLPNSSWHTFLTQLSFYLSIMKLARATMYLLDNHGIDRYTDPINTMIS